MSLLTLSLSDFQTALRFSNKIEDTQVRPFINDAYALDLVPLLGAPVMQALDAEAPFAVRYYTPDLALVAAESISYAERLYTVGSPLPVVAPPLPGKAVTGWTYEALPTLWQHFLKPWWLRQAYARFMGQHGLDVTKAGITVPIDRAQGTYERPSSAQSAALLASVETTAEAYRARLTHFLREESARYHADNTTGYNYYPTNACAPAARRNRRLRAV